MLHAPGWIDLYTLLEQDRSPSPELVHLCKSGRTEATHETMLHWYAIEGEPHIVQRLIDLGFDIDEPDAGGTSPIHSAATLERWDMIRVLRDAGAKISGVNSCGESYRAALARVEPDVPEDLRADLYALEDLLLPEGPEGVRVSALHLTRAGIPDDAPGERLDLGTWQAYAERDPDLGRDEDDPEDTYTVMTGEGTEEVECAGFFNFCDDGIWSPTPYVSVIVPSLRGRRCAYRIAQHFGARILWDFECQDPG